MANASSTSATTYAAPYATDASAREHEQTAAVLEDQLMQLNLERTRLESEYQRLPQTAGTSMKMRRQKKSLEDELELLARQINVSKTALRTLGS